MPLSQDFTNSRLEYLQSSLKNDNIIATQFYPRFQRHYNEMFPFTEGSIVPSINNPQQPVVSSSLNPPTLDMVIENLKTYLIPYVGDQANTVIKFLTDAQKYYYEANFEQLQKELLKQIKIPTSIESYLANLKMVLNSDKNKSNLSVLEPEKKSTVRETKQIAPKPITKINYKKPIEFYFPQTPVQAVERPPISRPRNSVLKAKSSSPRIRKNLIPDMSKQRRKEGTVLRHDARNFIIDSESDEDYKPKQYVRNPMLHSDTELNRLPNAPSVLKELSTPRRFASSNRVHPDTFGANQKATGIVKRTRFVGHGIQTREIKHKKEFHRYAIDLKKLHHNVLALKYLKNANNVATFKPIQISDSFKEIIENFLYDGEKINEADFNLLSITEKRILKRLYSFLKIDFDFDYSDDFQNRFQVMYGSFLAGNDSHLLKRELKEYIKLAVHEAIISEREGNQMLQKLDK